MHRVRTSVSENRLSDLKRVTEASYLPYINAGTAWVAEAHGAIVGFGAVDAPARRLWALFVVPELEGAGVGRALHRHVLEWAREAGMVRLSLSTEAGSRAVRFYQQAGWHRSGAAPNGELLFEICLER
jgi:GNAT superfamily N-acetyltransferase